MQARIFENDEGRRRANWGGIAIAIFAITLFALVGWCAFGAVVVGDWSWEFEQGIGLAFLISLFMLVFVARTPIENLPKRRG